MIKNINSIQVFNVASETGNVTRAAQLLNISQSSVSYHIKKLETDLGYSLFRRTKQGLDLTEEGAVLASHVEKGLNMIQTGLERVANQAGSVKVALLPMFSSRWLSSRLGGLMELQPDLQLSMHNHNNSFARMHNPASFADLGIQWGKGNWNGFAVHRLWPEKLAVVCSPAYLATHPISRPKDLLLCNLLHVDDNRMWEEWLLMNGVKASATQAQMMLEDRHFQLSSTINGLGVSLFASWLVQEELKSGVLVNPFGRNFETSFAYYLIVPKGEKPSKPVEQFCDWMLKIRGTQAESVYGI
ncbi:Glycine cleavage system transcriptional activator [Roseovarius gaetbuli]|uniref:Glycine cleavage system transcriptional activator n=1 Tax=Roseovarius gaetbuli TaxID=1356575 RepID=A0A1X7ABD2_9RHOB|nr:LysR substrate-binding domain-containing protein [Roseovarius gaetbuli]SLN75056.1 Glycine cleavage system transcriptional activator [Roseovarius gaetbuli]